jgi:branched-chain amino acid transport system ATP-binding protein
MWLLQVVGLVKRYGGVVATDNLTLTVAPGEVHAVIGPNGAGKTTLINQLTGELPPDEGKILFSGIEINHLPAAKRAAQGLARSFQISQVFRDMSVLQNMLIAGAARRTGGCGVWSRAVDDAELVDGACEVLSLVGLKERVHANVGTLAHGEVRQLELAMALFTKPKLLLLDEPMAGMSASESERIVKLLQSLKGRYGILLVEHDMDAIFRLADRITVLVNGRAIICGTLAEIQASREVREAYLGNDNLSCEPAA